MNLSMKSQLFAIPKKGVLQLERRQPSCEMVGDQSFATMKLQEPTQKRSSSGSANPDARDAPPSLSALISKSFAKSHHNKLLFASQSISMVRPIAISYLNDLPLSHEPFNCQLILIDFSEMEVDYLQETLRMLALQEPRKNYFESDMAGALNIVRMNTQQVDKRKAIYMKAGILSISSQVFLTDLLRGWDNLCGLRIKIILKLTDKVPSNYHYHAWMTTITKIKQAQQSDKNGALSILYLCNSPNHYSEENELIRICRTFFCKQVVIWPFGRAEIHKQLEAYRQKNTVSHSEYNLFMSETERKLHETLIEIYSFLNKQGANRHKYKPGGEHLLYSHPAEEGFRFTKSQLTEFEHVKLLLAHLENASKLSMLNLLAKFIEMKDCDLWNSNNSEAIALIENVYNQLEEAVFFYEKREEANYIELARLFNKLQGTEVEINFEKEQQFTCIYPMNLNQHFSYEPNKKIGEIIQIIEKILPSKQQQQKRADEEPLDEATQRLLEQFRQKNPQEIESHNVLIMCGLKSIQRYIEQNLDGDLTGKSYLQYIRSLHKYLHYTRNLRLRKIKKIYDKRKIKKAENSEGSKKAGDRHAWAEENKLILKEMLYQELEKLSEIILNIETNLANLNKDSITTEQQIYDINIVEAKIVQSFKSLMSDSGFIMIDIAKIKAQYLFKTQRNLVFETSHLRKKIFVDYQNKGIEPNYFHQLLSKCDPSTIIFYTPSPLLLRSLFLFQIENPHTNLKHIHILSYENSYQNKKASFQITKEDKAFWNISQNRSKLPQFLESPFLRIRSINYRDSIQMAKHQLYSKSLFHEQSKGEKSIGELLNADEKKRKVLVDTRQFKSSLPSYLYHFGFEVIPIFLKTADYILSDDAAIEKKSVHTKDLHNSLKNFRLEEQLRRMCLKFKHPYLLIECEEESDFVKSNFRHLENPNVSKGRSELRKRLMQLLHKFPSVRMIWSSSVEQTCEFIRQIKKDKTDPEVSRFIKQQNDEIQDDKSANLPRISEASSQKQEEEV